MQMDFMKVTRMASSKKSVSLLSIGILVMAIMLLPLQQAQAQSRLEISTTYPGISAVRGESITFPLQIKNNGSTSEVVGLEVKAAPEKWTASLRGRGREIQKVYVKPNSYASTDLKVNIPDQVEPGEYSITVVASGEEGYQDSLKLTVKIAEARAGEDKLVAEYSELKGPNDATFKFKVDLSNNGNSEQIYSLGAQAPDGWQVSFKPSYEQQQVASISVKSGETKGLDVKVIPPASAEAGEYTIPIHAVSTAGKATEELKVIISGTYDLELTTPTGRLNADVVAGKEKKVNLKVINTGSAVLNNINFSSREPQDWSVTFDPKSIDTLKAGESRQVTATITADSKAIAGDYVVSLTASTRETRDNAELRVTVKTSTIWGIVGILIVLLVIAGVYWAFRTYGRR
ncbi:MAG: hypothetical protein PWQ96_1005 [Clostridia bacterium]|nr:Alpha-galactosidase, associated protein [Clostridiales bacterium]MDK2985363.1 hypothetical protein [Clostridia bacterium]